MKGKIYNKPKSGSREVGESEDEDGGTGEEWERNGGEMGMEKGCAKL